LHPTQKPAAFDITHADGQHRGKTLKGIYSLKGNRLTICFGKAGERPKEFSAKRKSGQVMYVLKREKP
jgi:uncharacterized protein (TIGR03067 family)